MKTDKELQIFAAQIRKTALYGLSKLGAGHIGGSMSMADLMAVLYGGMMKIDPENPKWAGARLAGRFQGPLRPAVYAALALRDFSRLRKSRRSISRARGCPATVI